MTLKRDEFRKTAKFKFHLIWCQHCKAMQKANETVVECYYNPLSEEGEFSFCASSTDAIDSIVEAHNAVIKSLFEEIETPLEFAVKIAKVMDDLRSSHVFFIIQQALGDMDWEEAQGIFGTVIKNAENIEALKQKYGGE